MPDVLAELFAGSVGGGVGMLVGHPLDTVKVRMQASDGYRSALHCVVRTSRAEGPLALYKGMVMPLGATSAVFALCFSGYEHGKRLLGSGGAPSVREAALAGAFSALYTTPVQAPQELLKCRMQKATGRVTVRAAFGELWASGGLAALSRGFSVTLARDAAASAVYFATYVWTKRELARLPAFRGDDGRASFLGVFAAGAAAGVMNWVSRTASRRFFRRSVHRECARCPRSRSTSSRRATRSTRPTRAPSSGGGPSPRRSSPRTASAACSAARRPSSSARSRRTRPASAATRPASAPSTPPETRRVLLLCVSLSGGGQAGVD